MKRLPIKEELRQMRDEMDQMLSEVLETTNLADAEGQTRSSRARRPVTNITEKNDEYYLTAELPGVHKDDINLTVANQMVTIQVEHEETDNTDDVTKRSKRSFYKRMQLPKDAQIDDAEASYSNGILEIRLPKQTDDNARQLEIH